MDDQPENCKIVTEYNSIHLVYERQRLELRSHDKALQSVINLASPQTLELANLEYLMSVLLFIPSPKRILMLGTAAGSLLHFLRYHYPRAAITTVDIDAELIAQLRQMSILPPATKELTYVYEDAANFISRSDDVYDLVLVDVFNGAQTPAWLLKKAVIQQLYDLTSTGGALAFNLLIDSDHDFGMFYRNLKQRFGDKALSLPVAGLENKVVYAIREPNATSAMPSNMQRAVELSAQLELELVPILSVIYNTNPVGRGLL
jgi:spermidine synthase